MDNFIEILVLLVVVEIFVHVRIHEIKKGF